MTALNAAASRAALALDVGCATDITGFGLLGHANHIARASGKTLRIEMSRVPVFEGAREAWTAGIRTGGAERNDEYLESLVDWGSATDVDRAILIDPQTSGGLLVSISPSRLAEYLSRVPGAVEIGEVVPPSEHGVAVV
jgi:selenide, water dikinase